MKKTLILQCTITLAIVILTFIGCKKNDDTSVSSGIQGSWEMRKLFYKETDVSTNPPALVSYTDTTFPVGQGPYIEFHADNTYSSKPNAAGTSTESGTYQVINNNSLIVHSVGAAIADTFSTAITGGALTISSDKTSGKMREQFNETYNRP